MDETYDRKELREAVKQRPMQHSCSTLKGLLKEAIALRREEADKDEIKALLTKSALEIIR